MSLFSCRYTNISFQNERLPSERKTVAVAAQFRNLLKNGVNEIKWTVSDLRFSRVSSIFASFWFYGAFCARAGQWKINFTFEKTSNCCCSLSALQLSIFRGVFFQFSRAPFYSGLFINVLIHIWVHYHFKSSVELRTFWKAFHFQPSIP